MEMPINVVVVVDERYHCFLVSPVGKPSRDAPRRDSKQGHYREV